jgi:prephenate dehydrogenase
MLFEQITVVGVGLIGGSVGLAAKARGVARRVVGVGRDAKALARAVELDAIDAFTTDLAEGVSDAALVVVCTPVDTIAEVILRAALRVQPGTIFTDGGSTKRAIVEAVGARLPRGVEYVGAHPLAGAEKNGVAHARADLFEDRLTILTPAPRTDPAVVERVASFWRAVGSRLVSMTPEAHDAALAKTSHLPHAVASAVASATPIDLLSLTAGGFRDVTRIAAGDPNLWAAIFQANRESVLAALAAFSERIDEFQRLLETGDLAGLVCWLTEGKQVRDALGS